MSLTPKQQAFIDRVLVDPEMNATAAYKAVYKVSDSVAAVNGSRLLKNAKVAAVLAQAQAERAKRTQITADRVLEELARVGFSDMRTFTTWGPNGVSLNHSADLGEHDARCVAEVSETTTKEGGSIRFKLHDKVGALTLIAKHLGMFVEKEATPININFVVQSPPKYTDRNVWQKQYSKN